MGTPRVDQINVVVSDVDAAARFLGALGVDMPGSMPEWERHHQPVPAATTLHVGHERTEPTFEIDLDSSVFARQWGGLPASFAGVVLNLRVEERAEVDELHERALSCGGRSLKAPYDAFWGARFSVVEGPGPIIVGLMSVPDSTRRSVPPDPVTLV